MSFTPMWDPVGVGSGTSFGGLLKSAGKVRKPEEPAPEPEDQGPEQGAEEATEEKEKVTLKNPKWEIEKVGFNEETDISVEAELPEKVAHKTKVTFELFAKVPGKPERISQAEGDVKDGKATAKIPIYIPQYKDEEGNLLQEVEYYFTAKHSDSDLLEDDTVVKLVDEMANLLIDCHILSDVTFATNKSQVRLNQVETLKALVEKIGKWKEEHPDGKLAVFGHTDAEGKEEPNKKLSEKRARSIHAFLMKDAKVWDELAKEEKWNKKEDVDHQAFMDEHNTLSLTDKDFDSIDGKPHAGCSEFNLAEKKEGAHEPNRRVSVFLLKSNKNFPIQYPCKHGDIAPCKAQIGRKGDRRTPGFGCFFYDKLILEQAGGCGPKGTVKFVDIKEANCKQYVNMEPEEGKPEIGVVRKIEVEVEGLGDGDEVFWTVTLGEGNSARTEPKTGPKLLPEDEPVAYVEKVAPIVSTVEGGKSHILLQCSPCGGDQFLVEAGGSRDKMDCNVMITTWRKLEYETIHPKATGDQRLTDQTFYRPDKGPGFSDGMSAYLDKTLATVFVEFKEVHKACFLKDDFPHKGEYNIVHGENILHLRGSTRALIGTMDLMDKAVEKYKKNEENKRSVSINWCDYIVEPMAFVETFSELSGEDQVVPVTTTMLFERAVDSDGLYTHGDYFLKGIRWKPTHYQDGAAWKEIKNAGDPGYEFRGGGIIDEEDEIKAHVTYHNAWGLEFKWPAGKAHYPGAKIGRDGKHFKDKGKRLRMCMQMNGIGWSAGFNGLAWKGKIWMNSYGGTQKDPVGVGTVIAHELGHNMGQGYGGKDLSPGRGRKEGIPGIPFPKYVTEGDIYVDHGHRGIHCAKGILDKTRKDYSVPWRTNIDEHQCIMFGAMEMGSSKEYPYCEECGKFIRAEELTDIKKAWEG